MKNEPQLILEFRSSSDKGLCYIREGGEIKNAIYQQVKNYLQPSLVSLKAHIKETLERAATEEEGELDKAVSLMVYLRRGKDLTGPAIDLDSKLNRAAFYVEEMQELKYIAANLRAGMLYEISHEDAMRYGLSGEPADL